MSKRQTVIFLISALLLTLLGIIWGSQSKAESAPLGGSCDTVTPPEGMDFWNVPDCFGVQVVRAYCGSDRGCWKLTRVEYLSEETSGGTHHIYAMEPHSLTEYMEVCTGAECWDIPLDKPASEPAANFAMWANGVYSAKIKGAFSDEIGNLKMRGPTEETEYQAHHISYKLTWEWQRELTHRVYLPLVSKP
jgi:hypothetical protein